MVTGAAPLALVLAWAAPAWSAEVGLALDANRVQVGQSVGLALVLEGGAAKKVPVVRAPSGLVVEYQGSRTEIRQVNFSFSKIQVFQYQVMATAEGTFTLGPVDVLLEGGGAQQTPAVQLSVSPRAAVGSRPAAVEGEALLTPARAWEGQVVQWGYRVRSPVEVLQVRLQKLPEFQGLRQLTYASGRERSFTLSYAAGDTWVVEGGLPLVATGAGRWNQPAAIARVAVPTDARGFGFGLRQDRVETVPLAETVLDVLPLPPPPPGFSGLVGDFQLQSTVDADGAAVGGTIPWTITLVGDGDVAGFSLPKAADSEAVRFYDADSSYRGSLEDGRWQATATFERAIVPVRAGSVVVPPLDVVVFSPSTGTYTHLTAEVAPFAVAPGREGGGEVQSFVAADGGEPVSSGGPGVRPWMRWGRAHAPALGAGIPLGVAAAAAPGFGVMAVAGAARAQSLWARRRAASTRAPRASAMLASLPLGPVERADALDAVLGLAVATRLGAPVDRGERSTALRGLPDHLRPQVSDAFAALDRVRFGGDVLPAGLEAQVRAAITALEAA